VIYENRERGLSLVELLVAAAITVIVVGAALPLLARIQSASLRGMPQARRVLTRDDVRAELLRASDTAAKVAYFDLQATVRSIRSSIGAGGGGGAVLTPPAGYCLVIASDRTTWPPGFDPRDRRTWSQVDWWEGLDRNDPSTWYWNCGARDGLDRAAGPTDGTGFRLPTVPLDVQLAPTVKFGSGVRVGERMSIVGPLAVVPEDRGIAADQAGSAVTVLRTDPQFASFRLGGRFQGNGGVVQLVARDRIDLEQIEALTAGDILVVNGRTPAGEYATALAAITAPFHQIAVPSPADERGEVLFKYFEAPVREPGARLPFGLRNSDLTDEGVDIGDDASVALLDRAAPVVTYYTARTEDRYVLRRVVGDPATSDAAEEIAGTVGSALEADLTWAVTPDTDSTGETAAVRPPQPEDLLAVTVRVPLLATESDGEAREPIEATLNLSGVARRGAVTLHYRYLGETPVGPGGGSGGDK
jgi:hypothetical protein